MKVLFPQKFKTQSFYSNESGYTKQFSSRLLKCFNLFEEINLPKNKISVLCSKIFTPIIIKVAKLPLLFVLLDVVFTSVNWNIDSSLPTLARAQD